VRVRGRIHPKQHRAVSCRAASSVREDDAGAARGDVVRPVLKFWLVGALGFVVQLATLALLTQSMRWPWLPATIVAVESAILHNFVWHQRWTWRNRFTASTPFTGFGWCARFARFNASNGVSSIVGNVIVTGIFVRLFHLPVVAANAIAATVMSAINFVVA